jgi:hypothetical protein
VRGGRKPEPQIDIEILYNRAYLEITEPAPEAAVVGYLKVVRKMQSNYGVRLLLALGVIAALAFGLAVADDSVVQFYWGRARATYPTRDPLLSGAKFSYRARTYYKEMQRESFGKPKDSSIVDYYYSFGNLDSQKVIAGKLSDMPEVDLSSPNPFDTTYVLNSFPNDTGGALYYVGFDNDTSASERPVGLAVIDRNLYYLRWLYLYYPHKSGYQRFTRSFRFTVSEGLVFPDSVWEVVSQNRLFFPVVYRLETGISNIKIYR